MYNESSFPRKLECAKININKAVYLHVHQCQLKDTQSIDWEATLAD